MIKRKELKLMVNDCYKVAKDHGWHDKSTPATLLTALMMTELGEAVEELRKNEDPRHMYQSEKGKPEGFAVEVADFCIRIMDMVGSLGPNAIALFVESYFSIRMKLGAIESTPPDPITTICLLNSGIAQALDELIRNGESGIDVFVSMHGQLVAAADEAMTRFGVKFVDVIGTKMLYNETRPYRHGGKLL